jgi:hypothetical protein
MEHPEYLTSIVGKNVARPYKSSQFFNWHRIVSASVFIEVHRSSSKFSERGDAAWKATDRQRKQLNSPV